MVSCGNAEQVSIGFIFHTMILSLIGFSLFSMVFDEKITSLHHHKYVHTFLSQFLTFCLHFVVYNLLLDRWRPTFDQHPLIGSNPSIYLSSSDKERARRASLFWKGSSIQYFENRQVSFTVDILDLHCIHAHFEIFIKIDIFQGWYFYQYCSCYHTKRWFCWNISPKKGTFSWKI